MYRVILGASYMLFRRLTTELQTLFGILCSVRERGGDREKGCDSGGGGRGRLHFNHQWWDTREVRIGMRRASVWGCFELTGTHSVRLAPPSTPAHHPSSYDDTHFLAPSARSLLPPTVPSSPPPAPTSLLPFLLPSLVPTELDLAKKKRAGIFLSIPPGSLFFTRFFLPLPRSSGPAASGFFFALPLHRRCIGSRHRDFFSHRTVGGGARGGAGPG